MRGHVAVQLQVLRHHGCRVDDVLHFVSEGESAGRSARVDDGARGREQHDEEGPMRRWATSMKRERVDDDCIAKAETSVTLHLRDHLHELRLTPSLVDQPGCHHTCAPSADAARCCRR